MAHNVCGIFVAAPLLAEVAAGYDLYPALRHQQVSFLPIDHYYAAYWAHRLGIHGLFPIDGDVPSVFPAQRVRLRLMRESTGLDAPDFAIVMTEYFGGVGGQWALPCIGGEPQPVCSVNRALTMLGVVPEAGLDAFDTVGLGRYRHNPEYLETYAALCEEHDL